MPETKGKTLEDMEPIFGALPPLNTKILEEEGDAPDSPNLGEKKFDGNVTYLETTEPHSALRGRRSRSVTPQPIARVLSS